MTLGAAVYYFNSVSLSDETSARSRSRSSGPSFVASPRLRGTSIAFCRSALPISVNCTRTCRSSRGHKNTYDSIVAFSQTDFTEDLKKFDVPPLIIHGDDDQIVPIDAAARASKTLVPHAELKVYAGAPHGITDTHKDQLNADLLAFAKA